MLIIYYINLSSTIISFLTRDIYRSFGISVNFSYLRENISRAFNEAVLAIL